MIKHWEEFTIGPKDVSSELHVSLNRKGEILIGANAFEKLGRPGQAVLLFDRVNRLIGISPASKITKHAYPLLQKSGGRHRVIRANRFIRHHQIQVPRTVAFHTAEIDEDSVLVLDIKATRVIGKAKA
ncbi:MAG TPA: hypothetical protein PLP21_08270 [Pyrinomonadaceae bacterium]|nr:hypothetical protein [Acidobacteriota bacterium]HQZ96300.1 hypothetical protein [Pyrinomonadaceae bacterium]